MNSKEAQAAERARQKASDKAKAAAELSIWKAEQGLKIGIANKRAFSRGLSQHPSSVLPHWGSPRT